MSDSQRLQELRRQQALLEKQIERELRAAESVHPPLGTKSAPVEPALPPSSASAVQAGAPASEADALLAQLSAEEKKSGLPSKTGCWMIFYIALLLGVSGLVGSIYFIYRDR